MKPSLSMAFAAGCLVVTTFAAGSSQAGELVLTTESGWKVVLNMNNDSSFNRCIMQSDQNGHMLRLAHTGRIWSLSVPAGGHRNGADGTIGFNGGQPEFFAFSANNARAWVEIQPDTAEFLSRARSIEVSVGNKSYSWRLSGAANAMLRVGECLERFSK
jgi:hypothetical protein